MARKRQYDINGTLVRCTPAAAAEWNAGELENYRKIDVYTHDDANPYRPMTALVAEQCCGYEAVDAPDGNPVNE